ncbi:hypothetical protein KDL29_13725 [bacterium]|nr:hypothetical protein [bacterium]
MSNGPSSTTAGKRLYSREDLDRITNQDLIDRMAHIDNELALDIAARIFEKLIRYVPRATRIEEEREMDYGQGPVSTRVLSPLVTISRMGIVLPGMLVSMLQRFGKISFGRQVAEGPQYLRERLEDADGLGRLESGFSSIRDTSLIADYLISNMEVLSGERPLLRWKYLRPVLQVFCFCIMLIALNAIFQSRFCNDYPYAMFGLYLLLLVSQAMTSFMLMNHTKIRMLALYMSFTDEFVAEDDKGEDSADEQ